MFLYSFIRQSPSDMHTYLGRHQTFDTRSTGPLPNLWVWMAPGGDCKPHGLHPPAPKHSHRFSNATPVLLNRQRGRCPSLHWEIRSEGSVHIDPCGVETGADLWGKRRRILISGSETWECSNSTLVAPEVALDTSFQARRQCINRFLCFTTDKKTAPNLTRQRIAASIRIHRRKNDLRYTLATSRPMAPYTPSWDPFTWVPIRPPSLNLTKCIQVVDWSLPKVPKGCMHYSARTVRKQPGIQTLIFSFSWYRSRR